MSKVVSRDVLIAIFLLAVCGVFWVASFDIRTPDYGQLSPATWPRVIIGVLSFLCLIYLVQSVRAAKASVETVSQTVSDNPESLVVENAGSENVVADPTATDSLRRPGIAGFYAYWKNVIWCFCLFGLYLWSMPYLGMLLAAMLFVFILLCALGGWQPRKMLFHAIIALGTVGGMWSIFTYGLGVILPSGELFASL